MRYCLDVIYSRFVWFCRARTQGKAFTRGQYIKYAKMSLDIARNIVRTALSSFIDSEVRDQERDGSCLRYFVAIRKNGITYEVGVDSVTRRDLEN